MPGDRMYSYSVALDVQQRWLAALEAIRDAQREAATALLRFGLRKSGVESGVRSNNCEVCPNGELHY